jgi:hypothetical protein
MGSAAMLPFSGAQALPLQDLGFENTVVGLGAFAYGPASPVWTFTNGAGLSGNNSGFTFGNPVAPQGVQVAFLQNANSSFSQQFTTAADASLSFTFAAAQRAAGCIGGCVGTQNFNVLLDNVVIGHFLPTSINYLDYATTAVNVLTGIHTLAFVGLQAIGDETAFIDNIRVGTGAMIPVPAPGSLILLLSGVILMVARTRRANSVA